MGDRRAPTKSQQLASPNGKLLRMKATGAAPSGNPFGNLVWAYGIRNSYGLAFSRRGGRRVHARLRDPLNGAAPGAGLHFSDGSGIYRLSPA